jgi:hypothetical protein
MSVMQWSRLKKAVESRFAPSVFGRVELRTTNYRYIHDWEGRGWITVDRQEIHDFSTLNYYAQAHKLASAIREANRATDWTDPAQRDGYYEAGATSDQILLKQGIAPQGWFERSLQDYLQLSIEEALGSDNLLHRALAVLDRRLGKRRLRALELSATEHPLVRRLFDFRRKAEGLKTS